MRKFGVFLWCALLATVFLAACDLQPKIVALPDSVGDFIEERYPTLLADPVTQAEIYNSAATDYGVYASPELYGSVTTDDYIMYSDINDYMLPTQDVASPAPASEPASAPMSAGTDDAPEQNAVNNLADADGVNDTPPADVLVVPGTAAEYGTRLVNVAPPQTASDAPDTVAAPVDTPWAPTNDVLNIPMYGSIDDAHQIKVSRGDTLYSIAKMYNTTVPDLAAMNNLTAPYPLRVGQMLRVPGTADIAVSAETAAKQAASTKPAPSAPAASAASAAAPTSSAPAPAQKSDVAQKSTPAPAKTPQPQDTKQTQKTPAAVQPKSEKTTTSPPPPAPTPARVQLRTVTVGAGDTLYSISRAYSVPVNDLAVMNDLSAPFRLTVGQKLKVPDLGAAAASVTAARAATAAPAAPVAPAPAKSAPQTTPAKSAASAPKANAGAQKTTANTSAAKKETATKTQKTATANKTNTAPAKAPAPAATSQKQKISSDPKKKLPAIAARSSSKFSWPIRGKILSAFGSKPNGLVNDGINISATRGSAVKAAENGVVAYAGNEVKGMGNLVIIQHSEGWMTVYAHLDSMTVRRGAKVNVGQKIGTVGTSGKVDKPQLHFEIRKGTKAYNPSQYLKK